MKLMRRIVFNPPKKLGIPKNMEGLLQMIFLLESEPFEVSAIHFFECRTTQKFIRSRLTFSFETYLLVVCYLLFFFVFWFLRLFVCLLFGWFVLHRQGSKHRSWYRRTCRPWGDSGFETSKNPSSNIFWLQLNTSAGCCNTMALIVMRQTGTSWKCSSTNVDSSRFMHVRCQG